MQHVQIISQKSDRRMQHASHADSLPPDPPRFVISNHFKRRDLRSFTPAGASGAGRFHPRKR